MDDRVRLTDQAKSDLNALLLSAQALLRIGLPKHKCIRTAAAVEQVLKAALPGADSPVYMQAGAVSRIYAMPVESAVIWYKFDSSGSICVLLIDSDHKSLITKVRHDFERGRLNRLLGLLGIVTPLDRVKVDDDLLM